jgi:hypothetical protein
VRTDYRVEEKPFIGSGFHFYEAQWSRKGVAHRVTS